MLEKNMLARSKRPAVNDWCIRAVRQLLVGHDVTVSQAACCVAGRNLVDWELIWGLAQLDPGGLGGSEPAIAIRHFQETVREAEKKPELGLLE